MADIDVFGGLPETERRAAADMARDGLRPLQDHRGFITVLVLSAMLSALVLTYVYSERYRAETTVLFKSSEVTQLTAHTTKALGSPFPVSNTFKVVTQTIYGLADSEPLLRRVVTRLHLDVPEPRDYSGPPYMRFLKEVKYSLQDYAGDAWTYLRFGRMIEKDPVRDAMLALRKHIKLRNDDSYIYTVQATDKKPERAAAIADEVSSALVDMLEIDNQRYYGKDLAELARLRDEKYRELEGLEAKQRNLLASGQLASVKDEIEKATSRASQLLQDRAATLADLRQSEAKTAELAGKLRIAAPQPLGPADELAAPRRASRMTAEDYGKLTTDKLTAEVNTGSLRARLDATERSYAALLPHLQSLNQVQSDNDLLTSQLQSVKRDYGALTDAYQELLIRSSTGQSELRVQAKAQVPEMPISPIKVFHVAASGLLAALIAIGLAYVLDFFQITLFLTPPRRRGRRRRDAAALPPGAEPAAAQFIAE